MVTEAAEELRNLVEAAAARLAGVGQETARRRPAPGKWSVQELIGHLHDSAVNNLHRFVRAQEGTTLEFPRYEQEHWVRVQGHQDAPWLELLEYWRLANRHLARVIARLPASALAVECRIGAYPPVSLGYLVEDYLVHLRHHLAQIEERLASSPVS